MAVVTRNVDVARSRGASSRKWDARVHNAEQIARSPGFRGIRDEIIARAQIEPTDHVLDLGSGTGLLALAAAPLADTVWAVDYSPRMCEYLAVKARSAGLANVEIVHASAVSLPLVDDCIDVVVSNYCMHELGDEEKFQALSEIRRVLRPGGRLVFGDMMFSLELGSPRNRRVVGQKVRAIASRGLPGLLRLARNGLRIAAGRWEHPQTVTWWRGALQSAGFLDVDAVAAPHEGGLAWATKPFDASAEAG